VLWGEEDAWIPLEKREGLARLISTKSLMRIPDVSHLVKEGVPKPIVVAMLFEQGN
jgi:pimeloyl-ACP methyl ester carboxylesterase